MKVELIYLKCKTVRSAVYGGEGGGGICGEHHIADDRQGGSDAIAPVSEVRGFNAGNIGVDFGEARNYGRKDCPEGLVILIILT